MEKDLELNFQLGIYVGEYIVSNYLPTLSCDMIRTRTVIQCTIAEADEQERLTQNWHKTYNESEEAHSKEWIELKEFERALTVKYLPHKLRCHVPRVKPTYMDYFLDGLINALWNCDTCSYHLEKETIEVIQEEYGTVINLKLKTEWEPWEKTN